MPRFAVLAALTTCMVIGVSFQGLSLGLRLEPAQTVPFLQLDELRGGFMINDFVDNRPGEEDGYNIAGKAFFGAPDFSFSNELLDFVFTPRLFVSTSLNMNAGTSFASAGFSWDLYITEDIFVEAGLGGAIHDGPLKPPGGGGRAYGCRVNFYEYAAVGYDIDENWRFTMTADHFSTASLCEPNSGNSTLGLQIGHKF